MSAVEKNQLHLSCSCEEVNIDGIYAGIIKRLCKDASKLVEANSKEDLDKEILLESDPDNQLLWEELSGYMKEFRETKDVNSLSCKRYIQKYFTAVVNLVQEIKANRDGEQWNRKSELEQLFFFSSCRVNEENRYLVAPCHPMVFLLNYASIKLRDRFDADVDLLPRMDAWIHKVILGEYLKRKDTFIIYGNRQVYLCGRDLMGDGFRWAVPWNEIGCLTQISALMLIEKITFCARKLAQRSESKRIEIKMAHLGTLQDREALQEYFRIISVKAGDRNISVCITFTEMERIRTNGEYIFKRKDVRTEEKQIYNLSSSTDMKALFRNFDMVLFLDQSYFYRQGQESKSLTESGIVDCIQWCCSEIERQGNLDDKVIYYKEIFEKSGLWMNSGEFDGTGSFEFDRDLFATINRCLNPECDVYLYISQGTKIAGKSLLNQNICNDERYNGKRLLVFKAVCEHDENIDESLEFMMQGGDEQFAICIDLWQLVKSAGDSFRTSFFDMWGLDANEIYSGIKQLKHTYIKLEMEDEKSTVLKTRLITENKLNEKTRNFFLQFTDSFLKNCVEEPQFSYLKDYVYDLLTNAASASADSVEGVLIAYLMQQRIFSIENNILANGCHFTVCGPGNIPAGLFRARRTVCSVIEGLEKIRIRDMDTKNEILSYEFRPVYCEDLSEEVFFHLLRYLHTCCEKLAYKKSRVYILSGD